jgi:hypothetical protein
MVVALKRLAPPLQMELLSVSCLPDASYESVLGEDAVLSPETSILVPAANC